MKTKKAKKPTIRLKFERVKTAKKRRISSTKWLQRQLNDPYVKMAQMEGYRSRAAFKIQEINDKYKIFKKGKTVLDLGAAPGGWSQIAVKKVGRGNIVALDILDMEPMEGVITIKQDFLEPEAKERVMKALGGRKCDVVLTDMAANTTGNKNTDHLRIMTLLEEAYDFAVTVMNEGAVFAGKVFQGGAEKKLFNRMRRDFEKVHHFKPESSRKESSEMYIVALGFKGGEPVSDNIEENAAN